MLSISLLLQLQLLGQQGFFLKYETDSLSASGRQVVYYEDDIYVLTSNLCPNPLRSCFSVFRINIYGEVLWQKSIDRFDAGNFNSLWVVNDTISISGHRSIAEDSRKLFMTQLDIYGNELSNYSWEMDESETLEVINHSLYRFENAWYVMGPSRGIDGFVDAFMIKVDLYGNIIQKKFWDKGLQEFQFHELKYSHHLKSFLALTEEQFFGDNSEFIKLELLDGDFNTIEYTTAVLNASNHVRKQFLIDKEYLYLIGSNDFFPQARPIIFKLDSEGEIIDTFEFEHIQGVDIRRRISIFTIASNGDILGVGYYERIGHKPSAWMFRLTSEMELLWETTFRSIDWNEDDQVETDLNDLIELDNGDIVAVGWENESADNIPISDLAILRVDSNGCLYEDSCDFFQFTTSTQDVIKDEHDPKINLSPNPTQNTLQLSSDLPIQHYSITSLSGSKLQKSVYKSSIDVSSLIPGLYFITVWDAEGNSVTERFVKLE